MTKRDLIDEVNKLDLGQLQPAAARPSTQAAR